MVCSEVKTQPVLTTLVWLALVVQMKVALKILQENIALA
jgi:hypothetical protein